MKTTITWYKAKEKKPSFSCTYLVTFSDNTVSLAKFSEVYGWSSIDNAPIRPVSVIAWAYKPEPFME